MKVISGKYKGRNIIGFDLDGTRPTMDRVKESFFAMIQEDIKDKIVLDLFSGSGNLGIEAISQGAKEAVLVDANPKAYKTIKKNIDIIGVANTTVLNMDYKKALKHLKENGIKPGLIFLDPPYDTNYIETSIKLISDYDLLENNGLLICETSSLSKIVYPEIFRIIKQKKYGDKIVVILQKI